MYIDPLLPIAPDREKTASWPKYTHPRRIAYMPLSQALTIEHDCDAHAGAYSVPSVPHRLCTAPPAYARVEGGVPMVVFHWDIDCDASHRVSGGDARVAAGDAWWEATLPRVREMLTAHPGGFVFRTRGGAHIVYRLPVPLIISDGAGEIAWKRLYLSRLACLARRFALVCDPSVNDWPRLMRLPHVLREGVMQRHETIGDPSAVGAFHYDPGAADEAADLATVRDLAKIRKTWSPALRILANNAAPPSRVARAPRLVAPRAALDAGAWSSLAVDLGRALRRHSGRHGVHLALAGACYARGVPTERGADLARAICAASGETDDRPQVWETTAEKVRSGQGFTGYSHLARHWPDLAAIVDTALPSGGGAQAVRDELDARGRFVEIPAAEAAALVRAALTATKPGLQVVRITEGSGKSRTTGEVLRERALAVGTKVNVPSAAKSIYVARTHAVAQDVAAQLGGTRARYLQSVLAVRDAEGKPACRYHLALSAAVGAHHAVGTWCEGKGMGRNGADAPCSYLENCPARAGTEVHLGDGALSPAVTVTVHALLNEAMRWDTGQNALIVIDEDPDAVEAAELRRGDLEVAAASGDLFASTEQWRGPVLRALAVGLELGALPQGAAQLQDVFARGCAALAGDEGWTADRDVHFPEMDPASMLDQFAVRAAWIEVRREGEASTWHRRTAWAPRPHPRERSKVFHGTTSEKFVAASKAHATVARLVAGVMRAAPPGTNDHAERAVAAVEVAFDDPTRRVLRAVIASPAVSAALHRFGPTVLLDATADLAVLGAIAGGDVPVVDVRVADGAPVTRRLLYWSGASRKNTLDEAGARWDAGLLRYLHVALNQVIRKGARKIGLFSWKALADVLRAAAAGETSADPTALQLVGEVRSIGAELVVGHYGNARGRNDWMDCDALVSIGDPRLNVGATRAIAAVLGLAADHADVYRRATAAEVSQVAGRLRAPWRTTAALHIHVGTIPASSWDSRAEVMELPKGIAEGIDGGAVVDAVRVYGSARLAAAAVGVSPRTVETAVADRRKPLATSESRVPQSNTSRDIQMGAVCGTRDSLKTSENVAPTLPAQQLIDALGGAAAVAARLGVSRATVYHWRGGGRPMPQDIRAALLAAHAEQQATPAPSAPVPVRFEIPSVTPENLAW